ncbi:MAG: heme-binding domain-containing protein [Saprospiraceae bacterium]|nr:heme-binding domain-containing protein [Lewinellaceae bacterium]
MKKIIGFALLGILVVIQFIRPNFTNPPVDQALDIRQVLQPPADVHAILKGACYDCHSNETQYPWYSQVSPVSWWLAGHIREGREHLNFSTIGSLTQSDRSEILGEAAEEVQQGGMPLASYTWTHPAARLSATQRDLVVTWLNARGAGEGGVETSGKNAPGGVAEQEHEDND